MIFYNPMWNCQMLSSHIHCGFLSAFQFIAGTRSLRITGKGFQSIFCAPLTIDHLSMKKQTGELQLMVGMRGSKLTSTLETISIIWIGIGMTSGCLVLPQLPAPPTPTTAPISSGSFDVLWGLAHFSLFYFLFCTLCTKSQISGLVISLTNMNIFATIFIVGSM